MTSQGCAELNAKLVTHLKKGLCFKHLKCLNEVELFMQMYSFTKNCKTKTFLLNETM